MKYLNRLAALAVFGTLPLTFVACGGDDDEPGGGAQAGTGGSTGGTTSTGGSAGSGTSTGGTTGGTSAQGGSGNTGNEAGTGAVAGGATCDPKPIDAACDLSGTGKERVKIGTTKGLIVEGETLKLTADKVWTLEGTVEVRAGGVIEIEPCTRIEGAKEPLGVLMIEKGGKIKADGTADKPILFTSPASKPAVGDWGGIVLLGNGKSLKGTTGFEGVKDAPEFQYGGDNDADDSGSMSYVKIEFGGYQFLADKEVNGLSLAGVGSGTKIHHIMVSNTADDCFEWWGGAISDLDYLICNNPGDDMFDADEGWTGGGTHWFGRVSDPELISSNDPHGFEWDSLLSGAEPFTNVVAKNVTMCGAGTLGIPSYGMVPRELITGEVDSAVLLGWDYALDARDPFTLGADPRVKLTNLSVWGVTNLVNPADDNGDASPGDKAFDEQAWFDTAQASNQLIADAEAPFTLEECLAAEGPTAKVYESKLGAFKDDACWAQEAWTKVGGGWAAPAN